MLPTSRKCLLDHRKQQQTEIQLDGPLTSDEDFVA
jgi:hypothetical protein